MWNILMRVSVRKSSSQKKKNTLAYSVGITQQHKASFSASENNGLMSGVNYAFVS